MSGPLGLDATTLESCVQCGLCLPHCPTWRATGEEARSPRGRIDAMREVESGVSMVDPGFADAIESCVGCLACESACPASVDYGKLLEGTQSALAGSGMTVPWWQQVALSLIDNPRLVSAGLSAAMLTKRIGNALGWTPKALSNMPALKRPPARPRPSGNDVILLTGCVMSPALPEVHAATVRVLSAAGFGLALQSSSPADGSCCGALAAHRGLDSLAARQLERLASRLPPDVPVVSNSAGCGAAISTSGSGESATPAARNLAQRTQDVASFLVAHPGRLPTAPAGPRPRVALAVSCHLRNVCGPAATSAVEDLLGRYCEVVDTADDDICCGAGGSHSVLRPNESAEIRKRKIDAIDRTGVDRVASANPGCILHLRAGGVRVSHPMEIIDELLAEQGLDQPEEVGRGR